MIIGTEILGILVISFFLGIKHSLDIDHVVAVSSFLVRSQKFSKTAKLSIMWALGHTLTAGLITVIIFLVKDVFLQDILSHFEIIVSIMLIFIGLFTLLWEFKFSKSTRFSSKRNPLSNEVIIDGSIVDVNIHHHNPKTGIIKAESKRFLWLRNEFKAILSIGIIQGLASNDELFLVLVFTLGINDLFIVICGIIIFSLGVMIGMISWGTLINLPGIKSKKEIIIKYLNIIIGLVALTYGLYCLLGGEGINLIPLNF
ncbi:MAG: hypothetical protein ACW98D_04780 [Promethearchaeota archaeon]|jgi:ABC-type nickel/cobalt efflux system permease component RcnA